MNDEQEDLTNGELTALRDLVQSQGWTVLKAHFEREWGPSGYGWRIQDALSQIPQGPERAYEVARIAEQVTATTKAMNEMIAWPSERIAELQSPKPSRAPFARLRRMGAR